MINSFSSLTASIHPAEVPWGRTSCRSALSDCGGRKVSFGYWWGIYKNAAGVSCCLLPSVTRCDCLARRLISHGEILQWQVNQVRAGTPLYFIDLCRRNLVLSAAASSGRSEARVTDQQPRSWSPFSVLLKDTSAGWMSADERGLNLSPSVKRLSPTAAPCCQPACFQRKHSFVILTLLS